MTGSPNDNPSIRAKSGSGDGAMVSLLSLKLLLLAFFILLNALSDLEALKVRAVLESINQAFDGRLLVEQNEALSAAAEGPLDGAEIFLKASGRLFDSLLPALTRDVSTKGRMLIVELPIGTFFPEGERRLQAGRGLLLDRLAAHLRGQQGQDLDYEIAIMHGYAARSGASDDLRVERVAVLAEALVRRGVEAGRLKIGLYPASLESLRIEFNVSEGLAPPPHGTDGSSQ